MNLRGQIANPCLGSKRYTNPRDLFRLSVRRGFLFASRLGGTLFLVAYQPGSGNFVINEDGEGPVYASPRNNDIWDCLDDGADQDNLSDACVRVITLNDLGAESTGGFFDGSGKTYYFSVQHNVTGHGVILKATGWKNVEGQHHGPENRDDHGHGHGAHDE